MNEIGPRDGRLGPGAWLALSTLPVVTTAFALILGHAAGPFWLWPNIDPDYFYLFGAIKIATIESSGLIYHPGVPVQVLGAAVLKAMHPAVGGDAFVAAVLGDPERHLRAIGGTFIALNALGQFALGWVGYRAVGSMAAAILLQTAPLLSSLILKNAFHVKPEALLILATMALIGVAAYAMKPGTVENHRVRLAVAFGAVAGFAGATKVTALPVFVLPLFVLATPAAIGIYAVAAALSLIVFTLPMAPSYPMLATWLGDVVRASGPHGHGGSAPFDAIAYAGEAFRMLRRPPMGIVCLLGVVVLALAAWRARQGRALPSVEVRLLAGTVLAQVAQAVVVAKQPWGQYMIPAYMLTALVLATILRLLPDALPYRVAVRSRVAAFGIVVAVALTVGAGAGAAKLYREFKDIAAAARSLDDAKFASCARIYFYAASSPTFALYLSDRIIAADSRGREHYSGFSAFLKERTAKGDFWLDDWWHPGRFALRDWSGERNIAEIAAAHPCLMVRGERGRAPAVAGYLAKMLPETTFERTCSTKHEPVFTYGVDCEGRPKDRS